MPIAQAVKLNTGALMPVLGLGTWKSAPGQVEHAVEYALKIGYRHIDTASGYSNETEVGAGIRASGVPREEIFVVTKLANSDHKTVKQALDTSLAKLNVGYIDLWLMHWPAPMSGGKADKSHDWLTTWNEMISVYEANKDKVKAIGVSNFSVSFLERLLAGSSLVPAANQIELHPSLPQTDVREFSAKHGIVVTAYSPLGSDNSPLLKDDVVLKIAEKYKIPPATVLISYQANLPNTTVIPKSVTNSRILSNFQVVELTPEEIAELGKISEKLTFRACGPRWTGWGTLGFPDVIL